MHEGKALTVIIEGLWILQHRHLNQISNSALNTFHQMVCVVPALYPSSGTTESGDDAVTQKNKRTVYNQFLHGMQKLVGDEMSSEEFHSALFHGFRILSDPDKEDHAIKYVHLLLLVLQGVFAPSFYCALSIYNNLVAGRLW